MCLDLRVSSGCLDFNSPEKHFLFQQKTLNLNIVGFYMFCSRQPYRNTCSFLDQASL